MFDREKCEYVMMGLVGEIRYNFLEREGSILMPEMSCVDMKSAIAFFKKIDRYRLFPFTRNCALALVPTVYVLATYG